MLSDVSVEPSWRCIEVLALLRDRRALAPGARARIVHGLSPLIGSASLSEIGVIEGSKLTFVVLPPCILTASWDGRAKLWDAVQGDCMLTFKGHDAVVLSAAFSPDGQRSGWSQLPWRTASA